MLSDFYGYSGQKVSLNKSLLHFSANVSTQKAKESSDCLVIKLTNDVGRYLGMSSIH